MPSILTPHMWPASVQYRTAAHVESSYEGLTAAQVETDLEGVNWFSLLGLEVVDGVTVKDGLKRSFVVSETIRVVDSMRFLLDEFSVRFNESTTTPGFIVTIRGLQSGAVPFDTLDVFRRDVSGLYPDQRVRGMANIEVVADTYEITDYEAPLNRVLHYYIWVQQEHGGGEFRVGPVEPTPQPFIPTLHQAYGRGTAYLTPVDTPEIGQPIWVESWDTWDREARVLGDHQVLGRDNPVLITDVMSGHSGPLSGVSALARGQSVNDIEQLMSPGQTVLIRTHNPTAAGRRDIYVKFMRVSFERVTNMTTLGELSIDTDRYPVVVRWEATYRQVDRPDPTGDVIVAMTWQDVLDYYGTWQNVFDHNETWLSVLKKDVRGLPPLHSEGSP